MADRVLPGPEEGASCTCGCVNIHTSKIFDSCRDKDCVEDLRVYLTAPSQAAVNGAFSVRPGTSKLICANVSVDDFGFNRGSYTVDVTFFYRITGCVFPGGTEVTGLAIFNKRVILYGSDGAVKVYSSQSGCSSITQPTAYVEAVDPVTLGMKLTDPGCGCPLDGEICHIPEEILSSFGDELVIEGAGRRLYVTLGQFSIIRLERDTQLTLKDVCYFFPEKECAGGNEDDPCTLFSRVHFPVDEFYPPDEMKCPEEYKELV